MQKEVNRIHMAGEELQQFGFKNTDKVAIVINSNSYDTYSQKHVDHNSRWSVVKYFNEKSISEAINWLTTVA